MTDSRFSDRDIDRLLPGHVPEDEELATLTPVVEMLQAEATSVPSEETVERFAVAAGEIAGSIRPDNAQPVGTKTTTLLQPWRVS